MLKLYTFHRVGRASLVGDAGETSSYAPNVPRALYYGTWISLYLFIQLPLVIFILIYSFPFQARPGPSVSELKKNAQQSVYQFRRHNCAAPPLRFNKAVRFINSLTLWE